MKITSSLPAILTHCHSISKKDVIVCKNYWKSVQSLFLHIQNVLPRLKDDISNDDVQALLVSIGRANSLQRFLSKEEVLNLEFSSFDDLVLLYKGIEENILQLLISSKLESDYIKIRHIPTSDDILEWEDYKNEIDIACVNMKYKLAASFISSLQRFLNKQDINESNATNIIKLIHKIKKMRVQNALVDLIAPFEDNPNGLIQKMKEIQEITSKEISQVHNNAIKHYNTVIEESHEKYLGSSGNTDKRKIVTAFDDRIKAEVTIMSMLKSCANVIKLWGVYGTIPHRYVVTDIYDIGNLYCLLHLDCFSKDFVTKNSLNLATKLELAIGITNGIAGIHRLEIVHCDLKSTRVLIRNDFSVAIGDFGGFNLKLIEARESNFIKSACSQCRAPGMPSPEHSFSKKSDMWALGVILYEIFTGQLLHIHDTEMNNNSQIKYKLLSLKDLNFDIFQIIESCLKSHPEDRPTAEKVSGKLKLIRMKRKSSLLSSLRNMDLGEIKTLLKIDAELSICDLEQYGINASHYYTKLNNLDTTKLFLEYDNSLLENEDKRGWAALHYTASMELLNVLNWLIFNGVNVDHADNNGNSPLHVAAAAGKLEAVKALIFHGGNLELKNDDQLTPYQVALHFENWNVAIWLESRRTNENVRRIGDWSEIHIATEEYNLPKIKELIDNGFKVDDKTSNGSTPLLIALILYHKPLIHYLLEKGGDITCSNNSGLTPLTILSDRLEHLDQLTKLGLININLFGKHIFRRAVLKGWTHILKWLINENHFDANTADEQGNTLLSVAIFQGNYDVVRSLTMETDVNKDHQVTLSTLKTKKDQQGNTLLHCAAARGDLQFFKWLVLTVNIDINVTNNLGLTVLCIAESTGNYQVASWLDYLLDANIQFAVENKDYDLVKWFAMNGVSDKNGYKPLHFVANFGKLEMVKQLVLNVKVDVDASDNNGQTALHLAASKGHLETVKWLIKDGGAAVNKANNDGKTAVHDAAWNGQTEVIKWLILNGNADEYWVNKYGKSILHWAARNGHAELVKWLVGERKAKVDAPDIDGSTPLHEAAWSGHLDVVDWLISTTSADVDWVNNDGWTACHWAAYNGHLDVVKCLVLYGSADVNCKNCNKYRPYDLAKQNVKIWLTENGFIVNK